MGPLWRTLVPVGLLLVAIGFVAGAVATAGGDEPPRRAPVEMVTAPSPGDRTLAPTPTTRPSRSSEVPVVTPRPGVEDRDDDPDDADDADGADNDDERDDD